MKYLDKMDNKKLLDEILTRQKFLIEKNHFVLTKNELHWLGGAMAEYEKDSIVISILYDRREGWFYCKLFSHKDENKPPLFFHTELRKYCNIPSPVISLQSDLDILNYLDSFSKCLENNLTFLLDSYEKGMYWTDLST